MNTSTRLPRAQVIDAFSIKTVTGRNDLSSGNPIIDPWDADSLVTQLFKRFRIDFIATVTQKLNISKLTNFHSRVPRLTVEECATNILNRLD